MVKQVRFGRSFSVLRWLYHFALLAALPQYYRHARGDLLLGLFFLSNAATVPRQLLWCASCSAAGKRIHRMKTTAQHCRTPPRLAALIHIGRHLGFRCLTSPCPTLLRNQKGREGLPACNSLPEA
jgi:hypothetical protein